MGGITTDRRVADQRLLGLGNGCAMPIDRDVLEAVRAMDEPQLRRLYMLTRARLEARGHEFPGLGRGVKMRKQMVRCGKDS